MGKVIEARARFRRKQTLTGLFVTHHLWDARSYQDARLLTPEEEIAVKNQIDQITKEVNQLEQDKAKAWFQRLLDMARADDRK